VVSIKGEGFNLGVKYGNEVKPLTASHFPLFSGAIEADNITNYKYVVLDSSGAVAEEESIDRTYSEETSKKNEVYNRANKEVTIPELPQPFNNMYPMGTDAFKPLPSNVIYNIYAKCDDNQYANVTANPFYGEKHKQNNIPVNCTITIVSPSSVYQSEGSIHLIGFGSRQFKKLSWNMKFNKKFLGRKSVKLRGLANDATLIRENLATKLYKSVGVPVQEGSYARLFINGDTYGLYSIIDSFSKKWLAGYIHGNTKANTGYSYKIYADIPNYADFRYKGDDYTEYATFFMPDEYDDKEVTPGDDTTKYAPVVNFIKQFDTWINTPGQPIDQLGQFFNIEALLRLMVIDALTIAQDNFWLRVSNAALYYNPEKKNYIIIPYDFDTVLRGGDSDPILNPDTYMSDCFTWAFQHEEQVDHYFTKTLLEHPDIKKRYSVILAKTVQEIYNDKVISDYVNAVADLIRDDIQWNSDAMEHLSIPYEGQYNHYTLEQFEGNLGTESIAHAEGEITSGAEYGLMEIVGLRSDACKAATTDVNTSNNDNISDKEVVPLYTGAEENDVEYKMSHSGTISYLSSKTAFAIIVIIELLSILF
jgi:hypothetical protein